MLCFKCKAPHRPDRPCPNLTKALVATGVVGLVAGIAPVAHPVVGIFIRH